MQGVIVRSAVVGHAVGGLAGVRRPVDDGEEAKDEREEHQRALVDGAARRAAERHAVFGDGSRLLLGRRRRRRRSLIVRQRVAMQWRRHRRRTRVLGALVLRAAQERPVARRHRQKKTSLLRGRFL